MNEKKVFTVIFILALFIYSGLSIYNTVPSIIWDFEQKENEIDDVFETAKSDISIIDDNISRNIYERYQAIEGYGVFNRILGKHEINGFDYALDPHNAYEPINFWSEANDISFRTFAQQLVMFRDDVEANGGHFTFLMFPHKMNDAWNKGFDGIPYNDFNEQADKFLHWLDFYGVDYLDFREVLDKSDMTFEEMFYRTDHHWTGTAAFTAFKSLVEYLNDEYKAGLDADGFYTDESNYEFGTIPNSFIGSAGRDVGVGYSGMDLEDFVTVKPLFNNKYEWTCSMGDITRQSLYCEEVLEYESIYDSDMYRYYLQGINSRDKIINCNDPDAPKAFFVRDSFASPLLANIAPLFSETGASWGKFTSDRYVKEEIINGDYDYVFVSYYPENLITEFFKFYAEDVEQYKLDYAIKQGYVREEK
ncbi:MAG: hypothetical protein K6B41_09860 [Butyrivibrio sp.]|nr:hypothetical protein [Butyrivibrio sp.]